MIFKPTAVAGAFVIELDKREDDRGFFSRAWCKQEFEHYGLNAKFVQGNWAFTRERGTLRGLHYQIAPHQEAKLVLCIQGSIFDVIVDLRPGSITHRKWAGTAISASDRKLIYVPEGCAHGYLSLADDTELFYQTTQLYFPESERGLRWDDPAFGIVWPVTEPARISDKDRNWPDYLSSA